MLHNTPHWILTQRIDHALLLWGSSFTVGTADEGPHNATVHTKLESSASMATTPRPHVMSWPQHQSQVMLSQCFLVLSPQWPSSQSLVTTFRPKTYHGRHARVPTHHSLHTRVSSPHSNLPWRFFLWGGYSVHNIVSNLRWKWSLVLHWINQTWLWWFQV